jgi:hypothetical protein
MIKAQVTKFSAVLLASLPMLATAAVPSAVCRPTDHAETGISGETAPSERGDAGTAFLTGFTCNTDLVGQFKGEGASWQLAAWKNCAYFDQRNIAMAPLLQDAGVVPVDVSDPTNPNGNLTHLQDIAMIDPWESLKVNPTRQLLGGGQRPLNGQEVNPGDGFSVYDISGDCTAPVLQATVHLPGSFGHTGQFAPDGNTYWITPLQNSPSILAVDTTDPTNPSEIAGSLVTFTPDQLALPRLHDLEFSKDGNTAYITMFGNGATAASNGFAILDVSDFQNRRPNPEYRIISQITWDDGSVGAQNALPVTIAGKPYILLSDEGGGGAVGCPLGKSANGFPRLIDISDPTAPSIAAKIQLGVADPANCTYISTAPITASLLADGGISTPAPGFFAHSCHYCAVDNADDAKIAACNCFAAGFRVFDIHDITNIKEMAYFKPPVVGPAINTPPASQYTSTAPTFFKNYDYATSKPNFPRDRGATSGDIWTTTQDNGFMVIHLFSEIDVSPASPVIPVGQAQQFTATITGAVATAGYTWSLQESTGASIDANGNFTSTAPGGYHVVATSILDSSVQGVSSVIVSATNTSSSSGGCTSAPGSFTLLAAPLGLLLWSLRRRRQRP